MDDGPGGDGAAATRARSTTAPNQRILALLPDCRKRVLGPQPPGRVVLLDPLSAPVWPAGRELCRGLDDA